MDGVSRNTRIRTVTYGYAWNDPQNTAEEQLDTILECIHLGRNLLAFFIFMYVLARVY